MSDQPTPDSWRPRWAVASACLVAAIAAGNAFACDPDDKHKEEAVTYLRYVGDRESDRPHERQMVRLHEQVERLQTELDALRRDLAEIGGRHRRFDAPPPPAPPGPGGFFAPPEVPKMPAIPKTPRFRWGDVPDIPGLREEIEGHMQEWREHARAWQQNVQEWKREHMREWREQVREWRQEWRRHRQELAEEWRQQAREWSEEQEEFASQWRDAAREIRERIREHTAPPRRRAHDAGHRDRDAQRRDHDAGHRDRDAQRRDHDGGHRDRDAQRRDHDAGHRDRAAQRRDHDAGHRDRDAQRRDHDGGHRDRDAQRRDHDAGHRDRVAGERGRRRADHEPRRDRRPRAAPGADGGAVVYDLSEAHAGRLYGLLAPAEVRVVVSREGDDIAVRGEPDEQAVLNAALQLLNWIERDDVFEEMTQGKRTPRTYDLGEERAEQLFEMLAPSDVRVVVARKGDDAVSVRATDREHEVLADFLKLLHWSTEE